MELSAKVGKTQSPRSPKHKAKNQSKILRQIKSDQKITFQEPNSLQGRKVKDDHKSYVSQLLLNLLQEAKGIRELFEGIINTSRCQKQIDPSVPLGKLIEVYEVFLMWYKSFKKKQKEYATHFSYDSAQIHKNSTQMKQNLLQELKKETLKRRQLQKSLNDLLKQTAQAIEMKDKQIQKLKRSLSKLQKGKAQEQSLLSQINGIEMNRSILRDLKEQESLSLLKRVEYTNKDERITFGSPQSNIDSCPIQDRCHNLSSLLALNPDEQSKEMSQIEKTQENQTAFSVQLRDKQIQYLNKKCAKLEDQSKQYQKQIAAKNQSLKSKGTEFEELKKQLDDLCIEVANENQSRNQKRTLRKLMNRETEVQLIHGLPDYENVQQQQTGKELSESFSQVEGYCRNCKKGLSLKGFSTSQKQKIDSRPPNQNFSAELNRFNSAANEQAEMGINCPRPEIVSLSKTKSECAQEDLTKILLLQALTLENFLQEPDQPDLA